ncbi:MAG TPA: transporter [Candidatus Binataceae bacterium]|nr:transporter [Candidatus Binataceae bacterium]
MAMLALEAIASASEFGVSTYRPGLMDLFAGYLAPPGTTLIKSYFLFQDASAKFITQNGQIEADAHTTTYTAAAFAAHVTTLPVLGSYWGFGTIMQVRIAAQSLRVGPVGVSVPSQTSALGGPGDLIVLPVMLNWNWGQFHLLTAIAFYAPTGSYDRQRIINIGTNRWAVEPDVGLTWMDEEHGREASVFVGYTINRENTASDYSSGDEFHADFVLAQHLPKGFVLGMAGYALQQTTADSGPGAVFGPFRGRVFGLGPLIGKTVDLWKLPVNFTVKYDIEFAAQNRSTGNELWLTGGFRF